MKFLADENFPKTSYLQIKNAGFDISSITLDYAGITDVAVIQIAIEENRTLLTFDSDFGQLIYQHSYKPAAGVVYFRLPDFTPQEPAQILLQLVKDTILTFEGFLTVIDRDLETTGYKIQQRLIPK